MGSTMAGTVGSMATAPPTESNNALTFSNGALRFESRASARASPAATSRPAATSAPATRQTAFPNSAAATNHAPLAITA